MRVNLYICTLKDCLFEPLVVSQGQNLASQGVTQSVTLHSFAMKKKRAVLGLVQQIIDLNIRVYPSVLYCLECLWWSVYRSNYMHVVSFLPLWYCFAKYHRRTVLDPNRNYNFQKSGRHLAPVFERLWLATPFWQMVRSPEKRLKHHILLWTSVNQCFVVFSVKSFLLAHKNEIVAS